MPRTAKNPNAKTHACPHCDKVFQSINSVYAHVREKHPGKTYSTKKKVSTAGNTHPDTGKVTDELSDLKMQFVDDMITMQEYQKQKAILEGKLTKIHQLWEDDNKYDEPPTLDFKILDDISQVRQYINVHGLFDKLKPLITDKLYGKAFSLIFHNNLRITHDDKYDEYGDLLYEATYLFDGTQKTVKKLTTEDFWRILNYFGDAMCYIVSDRLNPPSILEKPSDKLTDHDEEIVEIDLAEHRELNEWYQTVLGRTIAKDNAPLKEDLDLVLFRFNHCLNI